MPVSGPPGAQSYREEIIAAQAAYYLHDGADGSMWRGQFEQIADRVMESPAHHQLLGVVEALYGAARSLELAAAAITDREANRRALDAAKRARDLAGGQRVCAHPGCDEYAPGYDDFCPDHLPRWTCGDCGLANHPAHAFCDRCGAGQPEDEDEDAMSNIERCWTLLVRCETDEINRSRVGIDDDLGPTRPGEFERLVVVPASQLAEAVAENERLRRDLEVCREDRGFKHRQVETLAARADRLEAELAALRGQ